MVLGTLVVVYLCNVIELLILEINLCLFLMLRNEMVTPVGMLSVVMRLLVWILAICSSALYVLMLVGMISLVNAMWCLRVSE